MANSISDVKVNISIEDVINPAAFGIPLLYTPADNSNEVPVDYCECYSLDEVRKAVEDGMLDDVVTYKVTAAEGISVTGETLSDSTNSITFAGTFEVEANTKSYGGQTFTKRIKSIEKGDLTVVCGYNYLSVYGISSSKGGMVDVVLYDADNDIEVARQTIGGDDLSRVTFEIGSQAHTTEFYIYGESSEGKSLHIYGIAYGDLDEKADTLAYVAERMFMQENPPEKIAVLCCDTTTLGEYFARDWRQLVYCSNSFDLKQVEKVAAMIESAEEMKIMFCGIVYFENDVTRKLSKAYERVYQLASGEQGVDNAETRIEACAAAAALVAVTCGKPVGSFTYKNMQLAYCTPVENISRSELNIYHDANVNVLVTKAGYDVTSEGKTLSGEYLDIIDTKDWLITQIEYQLQQALIINDKIPYDNNGISLLENVVVNILQDAYNNGMIATDDDGNAAYTVDFAPRSATKASDREVRRYVEGNFTFDLAGAIHTVTVNGTIRI